MKAIQTKRIEEEAKKLITDLYGADVYKSRQLAIDHYEKIMGILEFRGHVAYLLVIKHYATRTS